VIAGLRLAVSLLTILPVRGPSTVDRRRAGWAMTWAPLVGLALGVGAALIVFAWRLLVGGMSESPIPPLFGLGALAVVTGGLHLDGLADFADGLGARRDRAGTLEVMRDSAVGAFAVIALIFVLALQTWALTLAVIRHHGTVAMIVSVVAGRLAATLACASGMPAARTEGLGSLVAGSVPRGRAVVVVLGCLGIAVLAGRFDYHGGGLGESAHAAVALMVGLLVAEGVRRLAGRKLGGLTGDVLGTLVETATTVSLLVMAMQHPPFLY
jgi:adenosylcobinamide-GDP ribazoletransferase